MREPDVRLSDEERATFAALQDLLTAPLPYGRWARTGRWLRSHHPAALGTSAALIGVVAMVAGLLMEEPAVGAIAFVLVVAGTARATRRVTWAWLAVRWHRLAKGVPPEHLWEP